MVVNSHWGDCAKSHLDIDVEVIFWVKKLIHAIIYEFLFLGHRMSPLSNKTDIPRF
jgi:hypothetical protein